MWPFSSPAQIAHLITLLEEQTALLRQLLATLSAQGVKIAPPPLRQAKPADFQPYGAGSTIVMTREERLKQQAQNLEIARQQRHGFDYPPVESSTPAKDAAPSLTDSRGGSPTTPR